MKLAILYESRTGTTKRAAELLGGAARSVGAEVSVRPVDEPDLRELAEADAVMLGTWTDGLILFGMRPAAAGKFARLPVITGKPVGLFCTYYHDPGKTLPKLAALAESRGGKVVASQAFQRGDLDTGLRELVADVLVSVPA